MLGEVDTFGIHGSLGAPTFQLSFFSEAYLNGFSATESREVSLNGNVYDFSVDYNSVDKSDILNIHKHLMNKNNKK